MKLSGSRAWRRRRVARGRLVGGDSRKTFSEGGSVERGSSQSRCLRDDCFPFSRKKKDSRRCIACARVYQKSAIALTSESAARDSRDESERNDGRQLALFPTSSSSFSSVGAEYLASPHVKERTKRIFPLVVGERIAARATALCNFRGVIQGPLGSSRRRQDVDNL